MQSDALVEAMARAICAQSRPNADPDAWTAPERGSMQQRRIWHLFEPMARAALAALRQHRPDVAAVLGGWQPIETAPKDGSDVLIRCPGDSVHEARWIDWSNSRYDLRHRLTGWYWAGYDGAVGPVLPTHWRPLPPPPECAP